MNSSRRSAKLSPAQIKKLIIILALVLVVLTALVLVLRNRVKQQFGREEEQEVLSASVTTGSISSSVYGSGLLADEDVEQLDIPSGVDVETICVSRGEKVEEGQLQIHRYRHPSPDREYAHRHDRQCDSDDGSTAECALYPSGRFAGGCFRRLCLHRL